MTTPVVFSPRVLTTLNSLPIDDRSAMAAALTSEFLLGVDAVNHLSATQRMVYAIIRHYVTQDMKRMSSRVVELSELKVS